jgi:hypothetical protein
MPPFLHAQGDWTLASPDQASQIGAEGCKTTALLRADLEPVALNEDHDGLFALLQRVHHGLKGAGVRMQFHG